MVAISPNRVWRSGAEDIAILMWLTAIDRLCPALSSVIEKEVMKRSHSVDGDPVLLHSRPGWHVQGKRDRTPDIRAPAECERQLPYTLHNLDDVSERL
jgi:hypothetical protein